ncbi:MAG: carbamate kinase [Phycisphaerales bacterium]|nr:MAG: carbamate kinase [Phycisphaerales bacterium]
MSESKLIIVALGGNAITKPDEQGNVDQQFANSRAAAEKLADLIQAGHQLVITHGNGPQIGNFMLRNELAAEAIYPLPMEVAVAHVQGGMGYMIAQTFINELSARGINQVVTTVVTTVLVDRDDPSFKDPSKPIGRILDKEEAHRFADDEGWVIKEVGPQQYRRAVPSPHPQRILEIEHIRRAVQAGELLVTCGGGGIPVIDDPKQGLCGTRAVIDKDLASSLLAIELDADAMLILTNIDRVRINFRKPDEREVDAMTVGQAQTWLDEDQFPAGSMGPKIEGAITFLSASDKPDAHVIIGPLDRAADAVAGRTGTRITKS